MQSSLMRSYINLPEWLTKQNLALSLFGALLAFLVLNSAPLAILFPFAILGGLCIFVFPQTAYWAIVVSIPVAIELFAGLTVTTAVIPIALLSLLLNTGIKRCPWPISLSSKEEQYCFLFFFIIGVSSLLADNTIEAVKATIIGGVSFIIFFTTASQINDEKSLKSILWVLIALGLVEAIITIAQVKIGFTLPGKWRLTNLEGTDVSEEFRADGTTAHPILLAHYLQFSIVTAAAMIFLHRVVIVKILVSITCILMLIAWYYAFSRTSFVAIAITAVSCLYIRNRFWRILISCSGIAVILLMLIFNIKSVNDVMVLLDQLNLYSSSISKLDINSGQDSYGFRAEQFYAAWGVFLDNPIIGVGYEQAPLIYMPYLPFWATNLSHPEVIHNIFFKVLCEQGVLGLFAFLGLWVAALKSIQAAWSDEVYGNYAKIIFLVLVGQLVMGSMNPMLKEIWLSLGMAAAIGKLMVKKNRELKL